MSEPLHLRRWRGNGAVVEITHTRDLSADDAERDRIAKAVAAYTRALSDSAPILTDDGEALSRIDLIARIIEPVSFEKVRQGGKLDDAEWRCNRARDKAAHIETLFATRAPSEAALVEALEGMFEAFCRPLARRSMGGHTLDQQAATIAARAALAAAKGQQP